MEDDVLRILPQTIGDAWLVAALCVIVLSFYHSWQETCKKR